MTKSREQLVARALAELGVVGAGQAGNAEDTASVDSEVIPVLDDLAGRNIFHHGDPDQIPDDAFVHLSVVLAQSTARQFGLEPDENRRLLAESRLRQLRANILSFQPLAVEYF